MKLLLKRYIYDKIIFRHRSIKSGSCLCGTVKGISPLYNTKNSEIRKYSFKLFVQLSTKFWEHRTKITQ